MRPITKASISRGATKCHKERGLGGIVSLEAAEGQLQHGQGQKAVLHPNLGDVDSPPLGHWQIQACGQAAAHQEADQGHCEAHHHDGQPDACQDEDPHAAGPGRGHSRSSTKLEGLDDMQQQLRELGELGLDYHACCNGDGNEQQWSQDLETGYWSVSLMSRHSMAEDSVQELSMAFAPLR